jgi:ketosteroid isomerase-like protein
MKRNPLFLFWLLILVPLSAQDKEIQINNWNEAEEEVWALEEDYISYFGEANYEAILSLYHSQFLGWPYSELHPAGKKRAAEFLKENYPGSFKVNFKISREGIKLIGDVAITHYLVFSSWLDENGLEQKSKSRITHTWIKENSQWKILGGMSSQQQ